MSSILQQIFAAKQEEVAAARKRVPEDAMRGHALALLPGRDLVNALRAKRPAIIAEIKRASPSKGDIYADLDPASVAREYEKAGAAAISVLTDRHFKGSIEDLSRVRAAVDLPLLRKDFVFDPYQVYEARAAGADCILLIVAMLNESKLKPLIDLARELGMTALVEVHNGIELETAIRVRCDLIGINNRNLHNFITDIVITEDLASRYEGPALLVSESGIETRDDIERLSRAGASAFLVGESLLRDRRPGDRLRELIGEARNQ